MSNDLEEHRGPDHPGLFHKGMQRPGLLPQAEQPAVSCGGAEPAPAGRREIALPHKLIDAQVWRASDGAILIAPAAMASG